MSDGLIATLTVNPVIDASCTVDQVIADHKLRCSQPTLEPGGGGINVSRAVQELGGRTKAIWTCGGPQGELLKQLLDEIGLDHEPISIAGMTRQNLTVAETSSDQQYRFLVPGPELDGNESKRCLHALEALKDSVDYVVLSGSLAPGLDAGFYAEAARQVKGRVIVDTNGAPLQRAIDDGVFLIKPNLRELGQIAECNIEDDAQAADVARGLIDSGKVEVVVVSMSSGGAFCVTLSGCKQYRSPTVPIRSKVGAGDCMVAGIVLGLSRGESIDDCVRMGVAAGAAAVMTPGTGLCRKDEVIRLYEQVTESTR